MSDRKYNWLDYFKNDQNASLKYYRSQLCKNERNIYDQLYQGVMSHLEEFTVSESSNEKIFDIWRLVELDNPVCFFVKTILAGGSRVVPKYRFDADETENIVSKIINKFKPLTDSVKNAADIQKEKRIHDYFCSNIIYDNKRCEFIDQGIGKIKSSSEFVGPLLYGKGVCGGMAKAVKFLFDIAGLKAIVVLGNVVDGGLHAWNIVYIDGLPYHLDVTWDASYSQNCDCNLVRYDYFNLSDNEISKSHEKPMYISLPCKIGWNYYGKNNMYMRSPDDLRNYLLRAFKAGERNTVFQLPEMTDIEKTQKRVFEIADEAAGKLYRSWKSLLWSNEERYVFLLHIDGTK